MGLGKSVRLFLADGTPGGLITAEIMNWSGQVVAGPRSDLAALVKRPEVARRTGIYVLLGDDPESPGNTLAYIGESDDVASRLLQHARPEDQRGKDFWDRAVVMTSKDLNVTKAHAKFLESRFVALSVEAGRARLLNGNTPPQSTLPEADASDMDAFIDQLRIVLPVLGVNLLRSTRVAPDPGLEVRRVKYGSSLFLETETPTFSLSHKRDGVTATAQEVDGEFTVRAGSLARRDWVASVEHNYEKLYRQLVTDKVLLVDVESGARIFSRDYVFASPSAAAAVVLGRNANGRLEWRTESGMSYGRWQEQSLVEAGVRETADD
ncbi:GIY-YIG nuclease family protein [Nocardioides sp. Iso805N]|uniref:GIY-YIG nuclease family protein n=1 Tax=Nocardioides sp. Iso805N TaxID=1283287 RepID=UPI00039E5E82|nr:GIY-YIG nuclease family protein [Nocardioides sp. Iso805N]